ncbi:hypothetical protein B1748_12060 [Paenibacillus sp. MY03]|uniref:PP2C family protein-serine/threonine phosphatase n=1 Tax=Paenibacillus sp. MY03 TaxID=302980 RepID=UPI000B3D26BA|nr:SpoIIE family protein phosphatase [Paenibacillus sp. MY03]OUS76413.1 hypothetical protein B1748_12060 [Paenibacillus sp. MY03]
MSLFSGPGNRLVVLYALILAAVSAGMLLSSKYVVGHEGDELQTLVAVVLAGHAGILLLLCLFTFQRLENRGPEELQHKSMDAELRQWKLLTGFPKQLLWFTFISSMAVAQICHMILLGLPPWSMDTANQYAQSTLSNLTTYLALGLIFYSTARWVLRPFIMELRLYRHEDIRFKSATWSFILAAVCGQVYMLLRLVRYAGTARREGDSPDFVTFAAIGVIVSVVTLIVVYGMSRYLFRDIERLTEGLRELAGFRRGELLRHLPIGSPYEAGELTLAFNALQGRFEREYARLDRDIQLAVQVQQQLLSNLQPALGDWRFNGECRRATEVGGGFYDVIPLDGGRAAIVAGCVTGNGLPSALVMSSVLMLLRSRMQDAATAGEWLTRLDQECKPIMQEDMRVHIGIGMIDNDRETLHVAMAGQMQLLLEHNGSTSGTESGAEPLGRRSPASVTEKIYPLAGACRVTLQMTEGGDVSAGEALDDAMFPEDSSSITACRNGEGKRHEEEQ